MDLISKIQDWYHSNCNGEWEHDFGVNIGTLDNPGWSVEIDLSGTPLQNKSFNEIKLNRTDDNWIHCWVENKKFNAACGPRNLDEALEIFINWSQ